MRILRMYLYCVVNLVNNIFFLDPFGSVLPRPLATVTLREGFAISRGQNLFLFLSRSIKKLSVISEKTQNVMNSFVYAVNSLAGGHNLLHTSINYMGELLTR